MTKRVVKVFCILAALSFIAVGACWAELKVAFVSLPKLMQVSKKAQELQKKFADKVTAKKTDLENKRKDMESVKDRLEKTGPMLKEDARNSMIKELGIKEMEYKMAEKEAQTSLQNDERDTMETFQRDIEKIIEQVRAQKDLTLILNSTALLGGDKALDITDEVVRLYDSGAGADSKPKAAAPAGAAKPPAAKAPGK